MDQRHRPRRRRRFGPGVTTLAARATPATSRARTAAAGRPEPSAPWQGGGPPDMVARVVVHGRNAAAWKPRSPSDSRSSMQNEAPSTPGLAFRLDARRRLPSAAPTTAERRSPPPVPRRRHRRTHPALGLRRRRRACDPGEDTEASHARQGRVRPPGTQGRQPARSLQPFRELTAACRAFCYEVNSRTHQAVRRRQADTVAEEQRRLHPLPRRPFASAFGPTSTNPPT